MGKRYLEDLEIGKVETSSAITVERQAMVEFAKQFDPQYFHADEVAAADSRFGDVIASGQYTMVLWRQLDHQIAHDIAWICGIGWDEVRWPVAVRAGNTLRARSWCIDKRESTRDPSRGVCRYQYQLLNQDNEVVFSCVSTNLVETRSGADDG